ETAPPVSWRVAVLDQVARAQNMIESQIAAQWLKSTRVKSAYVVTCLFVRFHDTQPNQQLRQLGVGRFGDQNASPRDPRHPPDRAFGLWKVMQSVVDECVFEGSVGKGQILGVTPHKKVIHAVSVGAHASATQAAAG